MAVAIPIPHTMATWKTPTCAPVATAAQTLPQPKKTSKNVPKNSPIAHFGTGVRAISISALTCGGGSGRVALIIALMDEAAHHLAATPAVATTARFRGHLVILAFSLLRMSPGGVRTIERLRFA